MMRSILFAAALVAAGAVAPVPQEDDAARLRRLYGAPVVPDKECTIELKGDALRVALPDTPRQLTGAGKVNAPHTWREVDGDFTATVRVSFPIRKDVPPSRDPTGRACAGLMATAGDEVAEVVRTEFTSRRPPPDRQCENFHSRYAGPRGNGGGSAFDRDGPADAAHLRLTRVGGVLTGAWSRDGRAWNELEWGRKLAWDGPVRVGVIAENSYLAPFEATFDRFEVRSVKAE